MRLLRATGWSTKQSVCPFLLLGLLIGGCGSDPHLGSVTGCVTLDGTPLEGALVEFQPLGGQGSSSTGVTDEHGRYLLMHTFQSAGALPGEHRVSVRTANVFYSEESADSAALQEPIPERYNTQSELVRTVDLGSNVFDFELSRN